jgi:hypothetical protein
MLETVVMDTLELPADESVFVFFLMRGFREFHFLVQADALRQQYWSDYN